MGSSAQEGGTPLLDKTLLGPESLGPGPRSCTQVLTQSPRAWLHRHVDQAIWSHSGARESHHRLAMSPLPPGDGRRVGKGASRETGLPAPTDQQQKKQGLRARCRPSGCELTLQPGAPALHFHRNPKTNFQARAGQALARGEHSQSYSTPLRRGPTAGAECRSRPGETPK